MNIGRCTTNLILKIMDRSVYSHTGQAFRQKSLMMTSEVTTAGISAE